MLRFSHKNRELISRPASKKKKEKKKIKNETHPFEHS